MSDNGTQKPLTREQRREGERQVQEAKRIYKQLKSRFFAAILECDDIEGADLLAKRKHINAQWRLTCTRYRLIPAAFEEFNKFAD